MICTAFTNDSTFFLEKYFLNANKMKCRLGYNKHSPNKTNYPINVPSVGSNGQLKIVLLVQELDEDPVCEISRYSFVYISVNWIQPVPTK